MKRHIIPIFYKKQPLIIDEMLPIKRSIICTFLNPYTVYIAEKDYNIYNKFDVIASDGLLIPILNKIFRKKRTIRISFDMTSLAPKLFDYLIGTNKSIYFIGTTEEKIQKTISIIRESYPKLNIKGFHHGYIKEIKTIIAQEIIRLNPDVIVIGMGALKQDQFAIMLKDMGCRSSIYTCGGFLHQTCTQINYYPKWINKFHLRTLYRLMKEPYVWKRIIKYYPISIYSYILFLWKKQK